MVAHDIIALSGLFLVFVLEPRHGPAMEVSRNLDFLNFFSNLSFQLLYFDAGLVADTALLGAVVVGVVVDVAIFLVLFFVLGRDATSAFSAEHHAGVREAMSAWPSDTFPSEHRKYLMMLFFGDHGRKLALVPVTTSFRILEDTAVKRIGEEPVEGAACHRLAILHAEAHFVFGDACRFHRIAFFAHHHFKKLAQLVEALLIFLDDLHAFGPIGCVEVSDRCRAWIPAHLYFPPESALHVHTFGVVLKLCLTAEEVQQEFVIGRVGECLPRYFHFFEFADVEEIDNVTSVHRVS